MSSEIVIKANGLGKSYNIYRKPIDRLKQMLFRGRRKFYDEYWALQNIDLQVNRGETVGLIGRNGSGKSTFLQVICGTLQPTCGSLSVNGRVAALLELGAGFNPEFTGHENVYLAASILGLSKQQIDERYQSITDFAGIGDFIHQPVKVYSSGMYARLAFAVAAHVDADILIIDEILAVGDAAFTQKCMRFIHTFKQNGTIFFVSHDTAAVMNLCDRVVWLDSGTVRETGIPREVCHNYMAAIQNEKDASASFKIGGSRKPQAESEQVEKDHRHELLKDSNVKNIVEIFDFNPEAPWFGQRGATISEVALLNPDGSPVVSLVGGEPVVLRISADIHQDISSPIIGFYVKDRLGQQLFGDNTFITYRDQFITVRNGQKLTATFNFVMPYLPTGDYSIAPAIAEGNQDNHTHHQWIDDALFFRVLSSHVARGLIGVPMQRIALDIG